MARAVLGGIDTYIEDAESGASVRGTVTRDTRRIERTLIVHEAAGNPSASAANALIAECFPLFQAPGQYPVAGALLFAESLEFEPFSVLSGMIDSVGTASAWRALQ